MRLDPDASKICTIIFPLGKCTYLRLPMRITGSPDSTWIIKLVRKHYFIKKVILESESKYHQDLWTISTVHTNEIIRVQWRTKSD